MSKLYTIYIGTERDKAGSAIARQECDELIARLKAKLADEFGGYSLGEVSGGYRMSETGELVEEKSLRVELSASDAQAQHVREIAQEARDMFRQESVMLTSTVVESNFI